jgi:NAD(P)-dependent dehydrogenase (short-subunit alcohol dehydrogenase family)
MTEGQIAGRTVVITGAASGIGRALTLGFLADGAKVIAADIAEAGLAEVAGAGAIPVRVDVTVEADVQRMIQLAVEATGRVDVLFNNAGIGGRKTIEKMDDGVFERFIATHLFGGFYGLRAVMPIMRRQNYGRIITTIGRAAEARDRGWAAYGSAKAALHILTRIAAVEVSALDVLVNSLIPGETRSGMMTGEGLQEPEAVYPWALQLATLPTGGPSGRSFWNGVDYKLFDDAAPQ